MSTRGKTFATEWPGGVDKPEPLRKEPLKVLVGKGRRTAYLGQRPRKNARIRLLDLHRL